MSQISINSYNNNNSWHAHPGISSVKVEVWGGGGAGANAGVNPTYGGGGGGGAYSRLDAFVPVAGTDYTVVCGPGGNTNNNSHGGNSSFNSTSAVAQGGRTANRNNNTGNAGGDASLGTGDAKYSGGAGATGVLANFSGGGGSSGGNGATGRAGQGNTGGGNGTDSANLPAGANKGGNGAKTASAVGTTGGATSYGSGGGGASRNNTTARAGGNGIVGFVSLTYTMPLISALQDNFDDNTQDTNKWIYGTVGAGSTCDETGGQLVQTPAPNVVGAEAYLPYWSFSAQFDMTDTYCLAELVQALNADANCSTEFTIYLTGEANGFKFQILGNPRILYAYRFVSGDTLVNQITYDPVAMRWLKIRTASGVVYWDYSADGLNWTNLGSWTATFNLYPMYPKWNAYADNVASPGVCIWDNINLPPTSNIKTINALARASVKTVNGLAIASMKSFNGLT